MRFNENKYTKWYFLIVSTAKNRNLNSRLEAQKILGYVEQHHIVPKSMGGSDSVENLVYLTPKEHFCLHLLLVRMTSSIEKAKLSAALWGMSNQTNDNQQRYKLSSRMYDLVKKENSKQMSILRTGHSWNKGIPKTEEHKKKLSEYRGEKHHGFGKLGTQKFGSENHWFGMTGDKNPLFGVKRSEKTCENIKNNRWDDIRKDEQAERARKSLASKKTCPHCLKEGSGLSMYRYHFTNCKVATAT